MISKDILDWVLDNGITGALILVFVGASVFFTAGP